MPRFGEQGYAFNFRHHSCLQRGTLPSCHTASRGELRASPPVTRWCEHRSDRHRQQQHRRDCNGGPLTRGTRDCRIGAQYRTGPELRGGSCTWKGAGFSRRRYSYACGTAPANSPAVRHSGLCGRRRGYRIPAKETEHPRLFKLLADAWQSCWDGTRGNTILPSGYFHRTGRL